MRSTKLKLLLSLIILTTVSSPKIAIAGAGHDHSGASSFKSGGEATGAVTVDAQTVNAMYTRPDFVMNLANQVWGCF